MKRPRSRPIEARPTRQGGILLTVLRRLGPELLEISRAIDGTPQDALQHLRAARRAIDGALAGLRKAARA